MNENKISPCLTCTRVKNPGNCENKCCGVWSRWFLSRWSQIHGFYRQYAQQKGEPYELEKRSH